MSFDPTREEMLTFLERTFGTPGHEFDLFDYESAIYWFANDHHSGQWSNLYAALCASPYNPGRAQCGVEEGGAEFCYAALVEEYAPALDERDPR